MEMELWFPLQWPQELDLPSFDFVPGDDIEAPPQQLPIDDDIRSGPTSIGKQHTSPVPVLPPILAQVLVPNSSSPSTASSGTECAGTETSASSRNPHGSVCGSMTPAERRPWHMISERQRREKLTRHFAELSTILPCLKRKDKISMLGDAIDYVKYLEGRVKALEDGARAGDTRGSPSSFSDNTTVEGRRCSPQIQVKTSGLSVLVRIHCERRKGLLARVLSEVESAGLAVSSSSMVTFIGSTVDITILALMDEQENPEAVAGLPKMLNKALRELTGRPSACKELLR